MSKQKALEELSSALFGRARAETLSGTTSTTITKGVALTESANGVVSVRLAGDTISADYEGDEEPRAGVELATTVYVPEGATVEVALTGTNGTSRAMVIGVVGQGDNDHSAIEDVADKVSEYDAAIAKVKEDMAQASKAAQDAREEADKLRTEFDQLEGDIVTSSDLTAAEDRINASVSSQISTATADLVDTSTLETTATSIKSEVTSDYKSYVDDATKNLVDTTTLEQTASGIKAEVASTYVTSDDATSTYATKSELNATSENITSTVASTYATKDDLTTTESSLSSQITQSADSVTLQFNSSVSSLQSQIDSVDTAIDDLATQTDSTVDALKSSIADAATTAASATNSVADRVAALEPSVADNASLASDVRSCIAFGTDSDGSPYMDLSTSGSTMSTRVTNSRMSFMSSGAEVAYVSGEQFAMVNATVDNSLQMGNFVWQITSAGGLRLAYNA